MATTFIPVPQSNRFGQLVRRGIDQVTDGAALLKRARALIETMVDSAANPPDYSVAAAQFDMSAGDVQSLHQLLIASESLSGSDSFNTLITRLG
jgi:hypothetical protein